MAAGRIRHLVIAGLAAGALSGCLDGFGKKTDAEPDAVAAPVARKAAVTGDVEAPELFQATDMALWDGRPSLGGVWVASADVKDPQRVLMRNAANGKSVVGALFRRERENPGPRLQLSSDAAEALGLLAGQPGKIDVVALKTAAVEEPAPAEAAPAEAAAKAETGASVAKATTDALAKPAPAAGPGAKAAVTATPIATPAAATPEKPAAPAKPAPSAKAAAATKPPAPVAAPAKPPTPVAVPAAVPAAASAAAHVVQIGTFSVEANARQVAEKLGKAGVATVIRKGQADGKDHWSVNATGSDKAALLAKVKSLGFADAFLIK